MGKRTQQELDRQIFDSGQKKRNKDTIKQQAKGRKYDRLKKRIKERMKRIGKRGNDIRTRGKKKDKRGINGENWVVNVRFRGMTG